MNLKAFVFRKTVDDFPRRMKSSKSILRILRIHEFSVAVMTDIIRKLRRIMMARNKIHCYLLLPAKLQKGTDPDFITSSANRRSADAEPGIDFLYRFKRFLKQFKIFLHVRFIPKSREIRLIPNLYRPCHNLIGSVTLHQMTQKCLYKCLPILVGLWRRRISLPVKNGLRSACQFFRHKTKLQKWLQTKLSVTIHYHIKIREIIFDNPLTIHLMLLVNGQIIAKQSMPSDMRKTNLFLHKGKLFLIFLLQRKSHSSGSDTIIYLIVKSHLRVFINQNFFHCNLHLIVLFLYLVSCDLLLPVYPYFMSI